MLGLLKDSHLCDPTTGLRSLLRGTETRVHEGVLQTTEKNLDARQ